MKSNRYHRTAQRAGLMLLLACVGGAEAQQNPNGIIPLGNVDQPFLLLMRDPVVHDDLKLNDSQRQQLQAINDEIDMAMWSMRNKGPDHIEKTTIESINNTKRKLRSVLTREQKLRSLQIELWVLGMKSLLRDKVAEKVDLSTDQRSEIQQIIQASQRSMADLRQQLNNGGDAVELNKQYRDLQLKQQQDVIALLSDEQKKAWVAVLGDRIDVSKLGRIKFKAPEIIDAAGWVNSEPLSLRQLKGKVVALHFYAFA